MYLRRYLTYLHNSMCVIINSWFRVHGASLGLVYINTGPCHVISFYCCSYTDICNPHDVSPSLFVISRQFDVRYNPFLVPYTLYGTRISAYKHWCLSCHIILLLFIYRYNVIIITYLRRYLTYLGNSMCVIIPSSYRIHRMSLGLVYINTGPCHVI
jgi:hypothetical protein